MGKNSKGRPGVEPGAPNKSGLHQFFRVHGWLAVRCAQKGGPCFRVFYTSSALYGDDAAYGLLSIETAFTRDLFRPASISDWCERCQQRIGALQV